jgi:DNA-binding GntR family transcriptional regulator
VTSVRRNEAASALREAIACGKLQPGDRIGASLAAIAREYEVGTTTMQSVLSDLAAEGIVRKDHGVGYFVLAVPDHPARGDGTLRAEVEELRVRVGEIEARVMDLYGRDGRDYPARQEGHDGERAG